MTSKTPRVLVLGAVAAVALLAGCASREEAKTAYTKNQDSASQALDLRRNLEAEKGPSNVRMRDKVYLGDTGIRSTNGEPLPEKLQGPKSVNLTSSAPMNLVEIARRIHDITGIPVEDADLLYYYTGSKDNAAASSPTPSAPAAGANGAPPDISMFDLAAANGALSTDPMAPIDVKYTGSLSGLLDLVAGRYAVSWEYKAGVIRFKGDQTKTYTLYSFPTEISQTNTISGQIMGSGNAEGSASSSSSTSGITSTVKLNYLSTVEAAIKNIVGVAGRFSITPDTGSITVTARPAIQRAVEDYVRAENRKLGRQVAIDVKVLSLTLNNSDSVSFNLNALVSSVSKSVGGTFTSVAPFAVENAASLGVGIINDLTNAGQSLSGGYTVKTQPEYIFDPTTGKYTIDPENPGSYVKGAGSQAIIQALSEKGTVSLLTSSSVTTLNNQPAPVQVVTQTGYLAEVAVTSTESGTTQSLKPGTVTTGFNMNLLPRILSNGEVFLNYNVSLSDLNALNTYGSGDNQIQVPDVATRSFQQNVRMNNGATLVLAGFERQSNNLTDRGTGHSMNWLLGGGMSAQNKREVIVILLTPVVLENPNKLAVQR